MKKTKTMSNKKEYQAPKVSVYEVFIEQSFAAGSQITLRIEDFDGNMESEWQHEPINSELEW